MALSQRILRAVRTAKIKRARTRGGAGGGGGQQIYSGQGTIFCFVVTVTTHLRRKRSGDLQCRTGWSSTTPIVLQVFPQPVNTFVHTVGIRCRAVCTGRFIYRVWRLSFMYIERNNVYRPSIVFNKSELLANSEKGRLRPVLSTTSPLQALRYTARAPPASAKGRCRSYVQYHTRCDTNIAIIAHFPSTFMNQGNYYCIDTSQLVKNIGFCLVFSMPLW